MEMVYVNIETNEQFVRFDPIKNGKVTLYSIDDNSGKSDITVTSEELDNDYDLIEIVEED